ncbi:PhoH family protein [Aequoribacter sp.]|uniref:PhoH family protein n=1 Tax=Aequoribacter sp. TaxID=2847771 RepID=UPI003F69E733
MTQLADISDPSSQTASTTLEPNNASHLATLCGQFDAHLKQIEQRLNVAIASRGNRFSISGATEAREAARDLLENLYQAICGGEGLSAETLHVHMQDAGLEVLKEQRASEAETADNVVVIKTKRAPVKPRGKNQQGYVRAIQDFDINFGIGPAGTGKTYLAVACAVEALLNERVRRILLVRPAVEAGEKLGFLPGDLAQKIDPYLRPLYDALYEMLGFEQVNKYIERNIIEVAPLAFMRGRTLNNAFIILDEAQNTTREQMKMFLTRIGFGSTAVITGDATQIDLPRGAHSGLTHASHILDGVDGISFTYFANKDVVRHPLVQRVVEAYDKAELAPSKIESNSR